MQLIFDRSLVDKDVLDTIDDVLLTEGDTELSISDCFNNIFSSNEESDKQEEEEAQCVTAIRSYKEAVTKFTV
ncbi:hypothetical protein QE152_g37971 [Popillia japonica]|uniref:Uncharacterized protein n=1 Tax=Popillia japonica TaxID=7064 RepID=A0AAW1I8V5_POPJA